MAGLSLGQAAKLAGVGKTTIARAVSSGRLSAARRDDGGYSIDVSELGRVYDLKAERLEKPATVAPDEVDGSEVRDATSGRAAEEARRELAFAVLEEQVRSYRHLAENEQERREAAEADRDRWAEQAARIAALLPAPPANDAPSGTRKAGLLDRLLGRRVA